MFMTLIIQGSFGNSSPDIIAKINGEDIPQKTFDRLLNTQKKKLIEQLINETLILQHAKAKNLTIPEEEITKKLNLIKEKQGGEEAFNKFLEENNATMEDARNEIKNQMLIQLVKNQINDFNAFLSARKLKSDIVIYTSKIFPVVADFQPEAGPPVAEKPATTPSDTVSPKMEQDISKALAEEIQKEVDSSDLNLRNKEYPAKEESQKQNSNTQPKKIFISDIKESTIIEPINITPKPNKNSSQILQDLRRKIEQRRVTSR